MLKGNRPSRDSDVYLTLMIWNNFYSELVHKMGDKSYVFLDDIMRLPREDNVKRIRAHFQNDLNQYLPNSLEVAKQRRINEEVWREFARTGNL